jgi:methyl-accepting chemotaxis protein
MDGATSVPPVEGAETNNNGEHVLSAHATLPALGWLVFVELPRTEALEPLLESIERTAAVFLADLVLAALVAWFMVRRMVGPIRLLQVGAARIGAGDLAAGSTCEPVMSWNRARASSTPWPES